MPRKKLRFCVLDTETATIEAANEIARGDSEAKKRVAIAKPLVYDLSYCVCERDGTIVDRKSFLIAEIFCNMNIFNTAYYREKRPIYIEKLERGETTIKPWREVMEILLRDLETVDAVGAFNSMFDFKKAIPFTELYINKLYSPHYYEWEQVQRQLAYEIAWGNYKTERNPDFEADIFRFRGKTYPLFDLWGLSVSHLLNNVSYKTECLRHNLLTNSGTFFKSSAESTYQYLCDRYDFEEAHTALEDAEIESFILSKIAQRHAITNGIQFFPFRDLGYTYDFVKRRKKPIVEEVESVYNAIDSYVRNKAETVTDESELSNYVRKLMRRLEELEELLERI